MKNNRLLRILLFACFGFSCGKENISHSGKSDAIDLKSFFENEAARLQDEKVLLEKIIVKDGGRDTLVLYHVQWNRELEMFMKTDLTNEKPSSFKTDSASINGSYILTFTATDSALADKKIVITLSEGNISSVQTERRKKNFYYEMEYMMSYIRGKEYSIRARQQVRFAGGTEFEITGKFIN